VLSFSLLVKLPIVNRYAAKEVIILRDKVRLGGVRAAAILKNLVTDTFIYKLLEIVGLYERKSTYKVSNYIINIIV
jgi:hypothetical protein